LYQTITRAAEHIQHCQITLLKREDQTVLVWPSDFPVSRLALRRQGYPPDGEFKIEFRGEFVFRAVEVGIATMHTSWVVLHRVIVSSSSQVSSHGQAPRSILAQTQHPCALISNDFRRIDDSEKTFRRRLKTVT
jgi:hypothetical protein